jgi:hypothetical protein
MPIVSTFFGIIIRMYFGDHSPPHFHAEYQGERAAVDFNGNIIAGQISSKRACKLISEWTQLHKDKLMLNWKNIEEGQSLFRIEPLD